MLKGEFNAPSMTRAEFIVHRTKQKYYSQGDEPSRLALKLKQNETRASINAIRTGEEFYTNTNQYTGLYNIP